MKNLKLSIFLIIIVGVYNSNAQTVYSGLGKVFRNDLNYFVKTFNEDRYQINSMQGTLMTFHIGTTIDNSKVHIGKDELPFSTANYKLYVEDGIMSESLKIDKPQDWSDFVFNESYTLKGLDEVDAFIKKKHHLPDVPSEAEIKAQGYYDQHEINKVLLKKIEELTLYVIEQKKALEQMEQLLKETKTK